MEPKLIAYGSFNIYEIDGKAYLYDHIAKRFFRYSCRDYLVGLSKEEVIKQLEEGMTK